MSHIDSRNFRLTDKEEVDDYTFLNHPQQGSSGYLLDDDSLPNSNSGWFERREQLLNERKKIEERTLDTAKRSLGLIYETESTGYDTARNLVEQREKLENTEKNLDSINSMTRQTQKHLNVMKSWFGGFKSMFSKIPETTIPNGISSTPVNKSNLLNTVNNLSEESTKMSSNNHPALKYKNASKTSFRFDDDNDNFYKSNSNFNGYQNQSMMFEKQLNDNLDEMGHGLSRLKNLAMGLSQELDEQNDILPRLAAKAERAEDTIQYQNRQMRQQLKK